MHPLKTKNLCLRVDEQVLNLLFTSLTGFTQKTGKVPMKGYKTR